MDKYPTPGVYVEEISVGPKPIEGAGTSTAGMLGLTERGPQGVRSVTNMGEYMRYYGGYLENSYLPASVEGFFENGGMRCFISRIISGDAVSSRNEIDGMFLRAIGPGSWGERVGVLVLNTNKDSSIEPLKPGNNSFRMIVAYWKDTAPNVDSLDPDASPEDIKKWKSAVNKALDSAQAVETYDELSIVASSSTFFSKVINSKSFLIKATRSATSDDNDKPQSNLNERPGNTPSFVFLRGGTQPDPVAVLDDFKGDPSAKAGKKTGLEAFREVDEINIVYCPDIHWGTLNKDALRVEIVKHCESMKYRFAILDCSQGENVVSNLKPPVDSKFAAFYYPWIKVYDPLLRDQKLVPPGGFIAGIYARSDIERGVHKAPANEIVKGAVDLEFTVSEEQQAILNPRNVNVIRQFSGRGIRVWGARTTTSDPEWKYINVRRLSLFIEESIEKGTRWVVFEPNNEQLWARVKQSITNFLIRVWLDGALMGSTQEQAFFVDIGNSTMTPVDLNNGRLVCMTGIAPVKPAEFVILRIIQKTFETNSKWLHNRSLPKRKTL